MRGSAAEVEWGTGTTFVCEKTGEAVVSLAARNRSRGLRAQQAGVACGIAAAIMAGVWWRSGMQPGALAGGTASAFAIALLLWRLASTSVIAESVLVLGEVGVQIATETRGGWLSKRLVDAGKVRAAIINEHVSLFGVHNYVGLIVDGLDHMEVLFPVSGLRQHALSGRCMP